MNSKYTFFYKGPFSQWFWSRFTIGDMEFDSAEQYMMYSKAILFGDYAVAAKIMDTSNSRTQKALGRTVANFDLDVWHSKCLDIVYAGNYAKFTQNKELLITLLDTGDTLLVEASPYDSIWGIGLNETDAKTIPEERWPGTNWLGKTLTKLRNDLNSLIE